MKKVVNLTELEKLISDRVPFRIAVNPTTSEIVQKAVFRNGGQWNGSLDIYSVGYTDKPYLYYLAGSSKGLTHGVCRGLFDEREYLEVELVAENRFSSQQEIWEYLFSGGTVKRGTDFFYKVIDGNLFYADNIDGFRTGEYERTTQPFRSFDEWEKYIHKEWYEEIPEKGVLCWVWDTREDEKEIMLIVSYDGEHSKFKFETKDSCFKNAVPLTKEEVQEYILGDK